MTPASVLAPPAQALLSTGKRHTRAALTVLATSLGITAAVRLLSGAQDLTFLHTPDSQFYLSLAIFGDEVTDRAPFPHYYWSKLGLVLPLRGLVALLDVHAALSAWHFLLTLAVVAATLVVARPRLSGTGAATAACFTSLSSVIVGHIGDPYAAGTSIALLFVAIALVDSMGRHGLGPWRAAAFGVIAGWILMVNPYTLLIAGGAAVAVALPARAAIRRQPLLRLEVSALAVLAGSAAAIGAFLGAGRLVFPGLDWLPTVASFVLTSDLRLFAEPGWAWLGTETSLLVPLWCLAYVGSRLPEARSGTPRAKAALSLVSVPLGLAVGYKLLSGGNFLETSYYNALLWPPALIGVVVSVSESVTTGPRSRWSGALVLVATAGAWVAVGHRSGPVPASVSLVAALTTLVVAVAGSRLAGGREAVLLLVVLGVAGALFQLVQNGRPPRSGPAHPRVDYAAAYRDVGTRGAVDEAIAFERWLIASTGRDDKLVLWAEESTASAAAMQLWGPNAAVDRPSGGHHRLVAAYDTLEEATAIVTLARTDATDAQMAATVRAEGFAGATSCLVLPGHAGLHACIHHRDG